MKADNKYMQIAIDEALEGITTSKPTTFNTYNSSWNSVNYTAAEFILLESAGCVFLPAAGCRAAGGGRVQQAFLGWGHPESDAVGKRCNFISPK